MRMRTLAMSGIAALWIILVPVYFVGSMCLHGYKLTKYGIETKAYVKYLEPQNHRAVHYTFKVGAREYQGVGRAGFGNATFDQLSPGQEVVAFYLPSNPDMSCIGVPRQILWNNVVPLLLLAVISVAAFVGLYMCPKHSTESPVLWPR